MTLVKENLLVCNRLNARRFYSSMGNLLDGKGLINNYYRPLLLESHKTISLTVYQYPLASFTILYKSGSYNISREISEI